MGRSMCRENGWRLPGRRRNHAQENDMDFFDAMAAPDWAGGGGIYAIPKNAMRPRKLLLDDDDGYFR